MKKTYYYAMAFLLFLTVSCVSEKIESDEDRTNYNKEAVWEYNGEIATLNKVIEELKSGPDREKLERRLLKNDILWEEAKFLLIDNKRRILIPFLSTDRENVTGVLALVKDAKGKTTFDMTVRSRLNTKDNQLPFWNPGIWLGYFMALDKDILGIKNGNPGFKQTVTTSNNLRLKATAQNVCDLYLITTTHCSYAYWISNSGETYNYVDNGCTDTYTYEYNCYWVPDPIIPTDPNTGGDDGGSDGGGGGNFPIEPAPLPPSCESFNFVKTTGLWQVALVKNVGFKVLLVNDNGVEILHWIDFPKPISFGTPTNIQMGNTDITPGLAANASARALQKSMQDVVDRYGHTRTSDLTVNVYFQERLKYNYPLYIPGGRVNFNATENIVPTEYKTNPITAGNCN